MSADKTGHRGPAWGSGGRRFKSGLPDQILPLPRGVAVRRACESSSPDFEMTRRSLKSDR